jgi:hypothetical protein
MIFGLIANADAGLARKAVYADRIERVPVM